MDNQLDNQLINKMDPLDEISVIDKQNLITCYVMLVYNTLFSLGDSIAKHVIRLLLDNRRVRQITTIQNGNEIIKVSSIPARHVEYLTYHSYGPNDWDCALFDDSISIRLILALTTHSCAVQQTIISESTAINDEGEELVQQIVEETDARLATLNGNRNNNYLDDGQEGDNGNDNESIVSYANPPLKRYFVESRVENKFDRDPWNGVEAESTLVFGFRLVSSPEPEPEDVKCELSIKVTTYVTYENGTCILTSKTLIEESLTDEEDGEEVKSVIGETLPISLSQTMDRHFAMLITDAIATNYTAVIQIIGTALLLYFGDS